VSGHWLGPFVGGRCGGLLPSLHVSVPVCWLSFTIFGVCFRHVVIGVGVILCVVRV
jgi:hypothetical protein